MEYYQCDIFITSPTGAVPTSASIDVNVAEAGVDPKVAVSDYVYAIAYPGLYLVIFASDPPGDSPSVLGLTPPPADSVIDESGRVQTAFTLNWSDGTSDTVQFQSDLDAVPKPQGAALALLGLSGMALFLRSLALRQH